MNDFSGYPRRWGRCPFAILVDDCVSLISLCWVRRIPNFLYFAPPK